MIAWDENAAKTEGQESGTAIKGVALAIVTQNKDDEGMGRVKVKYPWHPSPRESYWARIAMPMAGPNRGFGMLPEIGDEVLVAFEREDIHFPYVIGALWNGKQLPPEANADGKNDRRVLRSRKKHHLLFDDGSKGKVELFHEKGRKVVLDDDGISVEDEKGNKVKLDSSSGALTIEVKGDLKIKARSITFESQMTLDVKAGANMTLKGSMISIN